MRTVKQNSGSNRVQSVKQSVKHTRATTGMVTTNTKNLNLNLGAGDGARTRDDLLGRQAFYH